MPVSQSRYFLSLVDGLSVPPRRRGPTLPGGRGPAGGRAPPGTRGRGEDGRASERGGCRGRASGGLTDALPHGGAEGVPQQKVHRRRAAISWRRRSRDPQRQAGAGPRPGPAVTPAAAAWARPAPPWGWGTERGGARRPHAAAVRSVRGSCRGRAVLLPGRPRSRRPVGTGSRRRLRARCAAAENPRARAVPGDAKPAVTGVSLSVTPSWGAAGPGEAPRPAPGWAARPPEPGLQPPTLGPWQRGRANNQRESRSNAVLCHWLGCPVRFSTSGRGGSGEEKGPGAVCSATAFRKGPNCQYSTSDTVSELCYWEQ